MSLIMTMSFISIVEFEKSLLIIQIHGTIVIQFKISEILLWQLQARKLLSAH